MTTYMENIIAVVKLILKPELCNYTAAYILAKRTVTVPNTTAAAGAANNADKKVIL